MARNNFKLARRLGELGDDALLPMREPSHHRIVRDEKQSGGNNDGSVREEQSTPEPVYPFSPITPRPLSDPPRAFPPEEPPENQVFFRYARGRAGQLIFWHRLKHIQARENLDRIDYIFICNNSQYFFP